MTNTMNYRGYAASMTFDPDDKVIVGRVLDVAVNVRCLEDVDLSNLERVQVDGQSM